MMYRSKEEAEQAIQKLGYKLGENAIAHPQYSEDQKNEDGDYEILFSCKRDFDIKKQNGEDPSGLDILFVQYEISGLKRAAQLIRQA
jgi:5-hydroxyisourate hydrolase-like protein (transthyretin family)